MPATAAAPHDATAPAAAADSAVQSVSASAASPAPAQTAPSVEDNGGREKIKKSWTKEEAVKELFEWEMELEMETTDAHRFLAEKPTEIPFHTLKKRNIMLFLDPSKYYPRSRAYFCPNKYPATPQGLKALRTDIMEQAKTQACILISNGGQVRDGYVGSQLRCSRHRSSDRTHRLSLSSEADASSDPSRAFTADGRTRSRCNTSKKPRQKHHECPMRISIGYDEHGCYLRCAVGVARHVHHTRRLDLVTTKEQWISEFDQTHPVRDLDAYRAKIMSHIGPQVLLTKTETMLTPLQQNFVLAQLQPVSASASPTTFALDWAEDAVNALTAQAHHFCLFIVRDDELYLVSATQGDKVSKQKLSAKFYSNCFDYANTYRIQRGISSDTALCIAMVWMSQAQRQFLDLFGSGLIVDSPDFAGACGTGDADVDSDEPPPLLQISARSSFGNQHVVLTALLANRRQWMYDILFSVSLPALFGDAAKNVETIVSNGSYHERCAIDRAIREVMPKATRLLCGWHLIDTVFDRHLSRLGLQHGDDRSDGTGDSERPWRNEIVNIKTWVRSWMTYCETEDECLESERRLFEYLDREDVAERLGGSHNAQLIADFIQRHIIVHRSNYALFARKNKRYYEIYYHTTSIETNRGIRRRRVAAIQTNSLASVVQVFRSQTGSSSVHSEKKEPLSTYYTELWNEAIAGTNYVTIADRVALQQWQDRSNFSVVRISQLSYLVRRLREDHNDTPVTIFNRTRVVSVRVIRKKFYLSCSCGQFRRCGVPCSHQLSVLSVVPTLDGVTKGMMGVHWWSHYPLYASRMKPADISNSVKAAEYALGRWILHDLRQEKELDCIGFEIDAMTLAYLDMNYKVTPKQRISPSKTGTSNVGGNTAKNGSQPIPTAKSTAAAAVSPSCNAESALETTVNTTITAGHNSESSHSSPDPPGTAGENASDVNSQTTSGNGPTTASKGSSRVVAETATAVIEAGTETIAGRSATVGATNKRMAVSTEYDDRNGDAKRSKTGKS